MKKSRHFGFTLIELLVSISIIGVLTAVLLPNFIGVRQKAKDSQKIQELKSVKNALRLYYNDNQTYPAGDNCTDCLITPLEPYLVSISQVDYTYKQTNSGEGFILTVGLEAASGNEDINSQLKCGVGETAENIYATCLY